MRMASALRVRAAGWLMACAGVAAACGELPAASGSQGAQVFTNGELSIRTEPRRISAGGFPNTSGNPFQRRTVTSQRVLFRGRTVELPTAEGPMSRVWAAWILPEAPRPAVLAATTTTYLVTDVDGRAEVEVLLASTSDGASWQWLDVDGGQPGEIDEVGIQDLTEILRARDGELRGGRLLLLGKKLVLDVTTLERYPFEWWESRDHLEGFNPSLSVAHALSPGGDQLVLLGSRYVDDRFEYALVAVDYRANRSYLVPFEPPVQTNGRSLMPQEWLRDAVEWVEDEAGATVLRPIARAASE